MSTASYRVAAPAPSVERAAHRGEDGALGLFRAVGGRPISNEAVLDFIGRRVVDGPA